MKFQKMDKDPKVSNEEKSARREIMLDKVRFLKFISLVSLFVLNLL